MEDKSSVVLLQQELCAGVRATEPFLIHLKQASSKHLPRSWGSELQPHSWPSLTPPTLPRGAAPGKESHACRPRAPGLPRCWSCWKAGLGRNPLAIIGCGAATLACPCLLLPSLWRVNAMCRLSERENISLARRLQQQLCIFCWPLK